MASASASNVGWSVTSPGLKKENDAKTNPAPNANAKTKVKILFPLPPFLGTETKEDPHSAQNVCPSEGDKDPQLGHKVCISNVFLFKGGQQQPSPWHY